MSISAVWGPGFAHVGALPGVLLSLAPRLEKEDE